jgi:hypothetical protein
MRFFFIGPRILGIRPGISFGLNELLRLATKPKYNKPGEPMTGSFLYVIRGDHNLVKVGVSTNPTARLASLRTGSAFPIDFSYLAVTPGTGFDNRTGRARNARQPSLQRRVVRRATTPTRAAAPYLTSLQRYGSWKRGGFGEPSWR